MENKNRFGVINDYTIASTHTQLDTKIASAATSTWMKDYYTDAEWEKMRVCAVLSAEIEMARINLGMNRKEFAKFMGVSPRLIAKWESGDYN